MSTNSTLKTPSAQGTNGAKKLTFLSIYFLGINAIIGSGAFLLPQEIYKDLGVLSILVLIVAALTVSLIALCYADLSSRFSGSGAAWLYSYNAFGKFTGFQIGLFSWFLGCLTLAAESVALLRTLSSFSPFFHNAAVKIIFPISIIVLLAFINLFGSKLVKIVNNISSGFKIGVIIFFIAVGIFFIKKSNFSPIVPVSITSADSFVKSFGGAFSVVFYMFTGFSFIPVAAAQMQNPQKNIPKALITVMLTVMILYSVVQAVLIGIFGASMVNYDIPMAQGMKDMLGQWAFWVTIVGMIISIFGVAFAVSFSTPALAASLATEHNLLPKFIGKKNKNGAFVWAILITTLVGAVLTHFDYIFLVKGIVLASFVQYVPSILAVIKFKHTKQFPNSGFSLKGGYTVPIIALIISMYLLTNVDGKVLLLLSAIFVGGTLLYMFVVRKLPQTNSVPNTTKKTS